MTWQRWRREKKKLACIAWILSNLQFYWRSWWVGAGKRYHSCVIWNQLSFVIPFIGIVSGDGGRVRRAWKFLERTKSFANGKAALVGWGEIVVSCEKATGIKFERNFCASPRASFEKRTKTTFNASGANGFPISVSSTPDPTSQRDSSVLEILRVFGAASSARKYLTLRGDCRVNMKSRGRGERFKRSTLKSGFHESMKQALSWFQLLVQPKAPHWSRQQLHLKVQSQSANRNCTASSTFCLTKLDKATECLVLDFSSSPISAFVLLTPAGWRDYRWRWNCHSEAREIRQI